MTRTSVLHGIQTDLILSYFSPNHHNMKRITLLVHVFILFTAVAHAQGRSNLTISTTGTTNLKIIYAGKKYSLQDRSQTFQNQTPGTYTLVIYQWQTKASGADYVKVYDGNVRLTNQKHLEITVMRFGKSAWDESDIARDEWNEGYTNPGPVSDPGGYNNYQQPATATQFAEIKKALANEYNEEERLGLAKVVLKNNWLSILQVKELAQSFYNEEKRLRFLKLAYDNCSDKGSYYTLAEIFYNSSYKKDLINFLGGK